MFILQMIRVFKDFKIKIWNFAPLKDESQQNDENVPKLLCVLSRHDGAVNCVRFSNDFGVYLASGSDDKIVMIWQLNK
jgi:protein HIRA/HIR1